MPDMTYTMIDVGEGTGGGMMTQMQPGAPSIWLAYVRVDDVAAATAKAKSLGAKVMKDVTPLMDMGSFSIIVDPTGAHLGLWQAKKAKYARCPRSEALPARRLSASRHNAASAAAYAGAIAFEVATVVFRSRTSPSVSPSIIAVVTGSRNAARRCPSRATATMPLRPRRSDAARGSGPA